jgi:molybdopterin-containing oxidoreductase family iron-sulfur binding subunit
MVIDLKKCIGCMSCVAVCKAEHNTPPDLFQSVVLEKEIGVFPNSNRVFIPALCNHCDRPTCVDVCPTGSTHRREDGIVMIDYTTCIGCGACIEHCPYRARVRVTDHRTLYPDGTEFRRPVHQTIRDRVAIKCDFCYHRVDRGEIPACCDVCPTEARYFGDLEDEGSKVKELIDRYDGWVMLPEKKTVPCVYYIG